MTDGKEDTVLERVRAFIGRLWGSVSTQALAILAGVQPLLLGLDSSLLTPQVRWTVFGVSVALILLRQWAPPPPAVAIDKADEVVVHDDGKTVTVTKAQPLLDPKVVTKPAGESVRDAVSRTDREKV